MNLRIRASDTRATRVLYRIQRPLKNTIELFDLYSTPVRLLQDPRVISRETQTHIVCIPNLGFGIFSYVVVDFGMGAQYPNPIRKNTSNRYT